MTPKKILEKIKALLALAHDAAASPNEAATALRQAQKLMEMHGIDPSTVDAPTLQEQAIKARCKARPTAWEMALIAMVADVFGAKPLFAMGIHSSNWLFIAPEPRAEVAAYAATVLLRKLLAARQHHIDTRLTRVRKRANKIRRADDFCIGWIAIVRRHVIAFALSEREEQAIAAYEARYRCGTLQGRTSGDKIDGRDFHHGWEAGRAVRLNHGLGADGSAAKALGRD